jgi:hypothetical protein
MSPSCVALLSKRARNSCASSAFVLGFCKSKRRSFFSFPPVITLVASESTATLRTIWPCVNVCKHSPVYVSHTLAEKSALPVTARAASPPLSLALHTAPLWPKNVPTQSPTQSRSMGLPSLQLDSSRNVPSSCLSEYSKCTTGRV